MNEYTTEERINKLEKDYLILLDAVIKAQRKTDANEKEIARIHGKVIDKINERYVWGFHERASKYLVQWTRERLKKMIKKIEKLWTKMEEKKNE